MSHDEQEELTPPTVDGQLNDDQFDELLQGKEAWWHFLDAKAQGDTPEVERGMHSLELQVVGRYATQRQAQERPRFQPHHTASLRCQSCQAQIPADLTFCVYCGGEPGYVGAMRSQTMIIHDIEDPDIFSEIVEMILKSNKSLDPREVWSALAQPPGVFFFDGQDEHALALVDRFAELGVRATITRHELTSVSIRREVVESILRHRPSQLAWLSWIALSALLIGLLPWWVGLLLSMGLFLVLWQRQQNMFSERYEIEVVPILNSLTGMTPEIVKMSAQALKSIETQEARDLLTLCLMEYYAIWRHLASASPAVRRLLISLRDSLNDLMSQIVESCLHYAQLEQYLKQSDPLSIERSIAQLEQELLACDEPDQQRYIQHQLEQRTQQLYTANQCQEVLPVFKQRLSAMSASLEGLRARVVSVTMNRQNVEAEEQTMTQILRELDDEVGVFEQTLQELAEASLLA